MIWMVATPLAGEFPERVMELRAKGFAMFCCAVIVPLEGVKPERKSIWFILVETGAYPETQLVVAPQRLVPGEVVFHEGPAKERLTAST